jgi:hypothetical protein
VEDELTQRLDALMRRINDNHEAVLGQINELRADIRNLRTSHETTQEAVLQMPGIIVRALERPLLERLTKIEEDVRKLKGNGTP